MRVVFIFDAQRDRVREVIWEDDGIVMAKIMKSDGSIEDEHLDAEDLYMAAHSEGGPYSPAYPAEVDDLRSAFKYLGKAADLAETLPGADLGDIKTDKQAS